MANGVSPNSGLRSVQDGHRQAQAKSIGRGVRHGDVRGMDVVDDRLAERGEAAVDLIAQEELIAMEITVTDGDPPFVSLEIRQLGFALSPQTGGCESDRGSALGEGRPRENDQADADRENNRRVNAHTTSSFLSPAVRYRAGSISASPRWIVTLVIGPGFTRRTMPRASMNTDVGTPRSA